MTAPAASEHMLPSLEIPAIAELAQLGRWVCWKYVERDGKATKMPVMPDGANASATDPQTWSTFADCYAAAVTLSGIAGVGIVLVESDDLIGVDLDTCINDSTQLEPVPTQIVKMIDSYTEISPSGRGLRIFVRGALPGPRCRRGPLEMYQRERFLTVTGNAWPGTRETIATRPRELATLYARVFGADRGQVAGVAYRRTEFDGDLPPRVDQLRRRDRRAAELLTTPHDGLGYPSESEADMSTAGLLAYRGLQGDEIEHALRWRRWKVGGRSKHDGYYRATVWRALASVHTRGEK